MFSLHSLRPYSAIFAQYMRSKFFVISKEYSRIDNRRQLTLRYKSSQSINDNIVQVTFVIDNGQRLIGTGEIGDNLLEVVVKNELDLDGFGTCEGELACCSCHVILKKSDFDQLPNQISESECDLLELVPVLHETSRLGCQVRLSKEMQKDGFEVQVPCFDG
ncbi:Adrenodoxin, mitochondrial [Blomia tropicalis]|nr:Adrenodoxin, mitochondrial [Blomia tropicalis]